MADRVGEERQPAQIEDMMKFAAEKFGRIDILVNNAAFQKNQESIEDIDYEQLERTFRTNFFAYFYLAKAAVPNVSRVP